ncbi:hypothetical protein ACH4TP_37920 [Streptomyces sp. NPDC021012]|uniref:hypothetical protein n=1 Tax=Streptomyces sp. NPDC021012 TaxID=3365107 RepID=UPI00378B3D58
MNSGDTTSPAERLRLIQEHFLAPGATGPRAERVARTTEPAAAMRIDVYDHMRNAVTETVALAKELCDEHEPYEPRPAKLEHLYEWLVAETPHLDEERRQARDAVIYRQGLEHAILIGEADIIRRHPCPSCVTWGLVWDRHTKSVVCWNRHCADDDGQATRWTLAQLAEDHIARKNRRAARAT